MRSLPRTRRRLATGLVVGVLTTLMLTSCGSSDDDSDVSADDSSGSPSSETTSSPSPSSTPSEVATNSPKASQAPSSSATTEGSDTPVEDLFLTATEMPGLNDGTVWQVGSTEPEDGPFGDCAKFGLVDSGAETARVRRFTAEGDQSAAQLIATFADAKSAWRAQQVLKGWHRDCAQQLNAAVEKVGPIATEKVGAGKAFTYLVQFGPKDAELHHFNGVAINRVGATLSVVLVDTMSQDYNYDEGQTPAEQSARAVAGKLR